MRKKIVTTFDYIDRLAAQALISVSVERNSIIGLLFHGIIKNEDELEAGLIKPDYVSTIDYLHNTIEYYLSKGYSFIGPGNMIQGLDESRKYVLLTFDDGYYNNSAVLPVIEEFNVPATFFISSNFIEKNTGFWWDVVYRERIKRKTSLHAIGREMSTLERVKPSVIKNHIVQEFGIKALAPVCEIDRPFTFNELKQFSAHRLVTLGNHTRNHAVLTILNKKEVIEEISACQNFLARVNENLCPVISYPMGYYNDTIAEIAKDLGFVFGFTVNEKKNYFPIPANDIEPLLLNRFTPLRGKDWQKQLLDYRTDYHIKKTIKKIVSNG